MKSSKELAPVPAVLQELFKNLYLRMYQQISRDGHTDFPPALIMFRERDHGQAIMPMETDCEQAKEITALVIPAAIKSFEADYVIVVTEENNGYAVWVAESFSSGETLLKWHPDRNAAIEYAVERAPIDQTVLNAIMKDIRTEGA